jgi:hypothetical protein
MQGKMLRQVLDKMMVSGTAQNARVQVCLPDGKFYDIAGLQLVEKVFDALSRTPKLYEGKVIRNLVAGGLKLEPMLQGFSPIKNFLENK